MAGELDSGGSGGGASDNTTSTTSDVNEAALRGLGLGWLAAYEDVLRGFGRRPIQFIAGAILTIVLGGAETILLALLGAVRALGDAVAALPLTAAGVLTDSGGAVGSALLSSISGINGALLNAVQLAGPAAPAVAAAIIVVEVAVAVVLLRTLARVVIDLIPGGGGLL